MCIGKPVKSLKERKACVANAPSMHFCCFVFQWNCSNWEGTKQHKPYGKIHGLNNLAEKDAHLYFPRNPRGLFF